ncbi:MAG: transposase [Candidatus Zixiibacteriota bacterium]
MPNLKHFDGFGTIRFVTFSCHKRLPLLFDEKDILIFLKHLSEIKEKYSIKLFSYVIMPEHIHLVMLPKDTDRIGLIIGELKSLPGRAIIDRWRHINHPRLIDVKVLRDGKAKYAFWQKRCFDFNCRTRERAIEKINYCHKNSVT